jgi:hypothetical protein
MATIARTETSVCVKGIARSNLICFIRNSIVVIDEGQATFIRNPLLIIAGDQVIAGDQDLFL